MDQNTQSQSVFLNGKAQIIEMLQIMSEAEKEMLLKHIKMRNPQLASELKEKSLTFSHINQLDDASLRSIFPYIKAPILGMALKDTEPQFQRRVLKLAPRNYAEEAYNILVTPMANEKRDSARAQKKVLEILISLHRKGQRLL